MAVSVHDATHKRGIKHHFPGRNCPLVRSLLASRYADCRRATLQHLPADAYPPEQIERLLLNRSARVRELAQWRYGQQGKKSVEFYRRALATLAAADAVVAALAGVGGLGASQDLSRVLPWLDDQRASVRAAGVRAAHALVGAGGLPDRVAELLLDPNAAVAAAAADALSRRARSVVDRDAVESAWQSEQAWSRLAAWRTARNGDSWERVVAHLRAAGAADEPLIALGRAGARNWLVRDAATTWNQPDSEQRERLADLLQRSGLGQDVQKVIAFHAGLSTSVTSRSVPAPDRPLGSCS